MFPEEKACNEVAAIQYIQDHISIPVSLIRTLTLVSRKSCMDGLRIFYFNLIKYPFLGLDPWKKLITLPMKWHADLYQSI